MPHRRRDSTDYRRLEERESIYFRRWQNSQMTLLGRDDGNLPQIIVHKLSKCAERKALVRRAIHICTCIEDLNGKVDELQEQNCSNSCRNVC